MNLLGLVVLLAVIVKGDGQPGINSLCTDSQTEEYVTNCTKPIISLLGSNTLGGIMSSGSLKTICKSENVAAIRTAYKCIHEGAKSCTPEEWQKALTSFSDQSDAMDYECQYVADIKIPCIKSNANALATCLGNAGARSMKTSQTVEEYMQYVCKTSKLSAGCFRSTMSGCSGNTGEVLAHAVELASRAMCGAVAIGPSSFHIVLGIVALWFINLKF